MRYFLFISLVLCTIGAFSQKKQAPPFVRPLPVPHRAVNDFAKFINENEKAWLEKELVSYHRQTGNAIVFISLLSLTDPKTKKEYTIEEAATLYFNTWGIGDSIKNNGVLLMASKNPRRVRIEVGRGLEPILTNNVCQAIIDEKLVPNFRQGLFFTGIKEAVQAIENKLDAKVAAVIPVAIPSIALNEIADNRMEVDDNRNNDKPFAWGVIVQLGFAFAFIVLIFRFARMQARRFGGWFSGSGYNHGYHRRGYYNNNNTYNNNNFFSGSGYRSSGGGRSSSSSSSSSGSYGGGSSNGGGASGSW